MRWWSAFDRAEVGRGLRADRRRRVRLRARASCSGRRSSRSPIASTPRCSSAWCRWPTRPERAGLAIVPTLFTGHMSGVDWIPGWALGGTERDARFRVVSGGRVVPDGRAELVRGPRHRARAGAAGGRGGGGARRAPGAVGLGPGQRELQLHRSRPIGRSRGDGSSATTGAIRAADACGGGHDRHPHGGPGGGSASRSARRPRRRATSSRCTATRSTRRGRDGPTDERAGAVPGACHALAGRRGRRAVLGVRAADAPRGEPGRAAAARRRGSRRRRYTETRAPRAASGRMHRGDALVLRRLRPGGSGPTLRSTRRVHERSFGLWRADGSAETGGRRRRRVRGRHAVGASRRRAGSTSTPSGTGERPGVELPRLYGRFKETRTGVGVDDGRPCHGAIATILEQLEARRVVPHRVAVTREPLRGPERPGGPRSDTDRAASGTSSTCPRPPGRRRRRPTSSTPMRSCAVAGDAPPPARRSGRQQRPRRCSQVDRAVDVCRRRSSTPGPGSTRPK